MCVRLPGTTLPMGSPTTGPTRDTEADAAATRGGGAVGLVAGIVGAVLGVLLLGVLYIVVRQFDGEMRTHVDRSQNSPIGPSLIDTSISFKLCAVDLLDLLGVLRAVSVSACNVCRSVLQ